MPGASVMWPSRHRSGAAGRPFDLDGRQRQWRGARRRSQRAGIDDDEAGRSPDEEPPTRAARGRSARRLCCRQAVGGVQHDGSAGSDIGPNEASGHGQPQPAVAVVHDRADGRVAEHRGDGLAAQAACRWVDGVEAGLRADPDRPVCVFGERVDGSAAERLRGSTPVRVVDEPPATVGQ